MLMLEGPEEEVGGGDTAVQSGAEEGGDNLEEVVPWAGAGVGIGQMMMLEGPEEGVGGGDAVEESGAEVGGDDWEEGVEPSTEKEGTGAEAAGGAGQPMVVQQAEVGNDPEGKGAARVGFWIGDWDFTAQWEEMHRQQERDAWRNYGRQARSRC